jgi:plastocyanin
VVENTVTPRSPSTATLRIAAVNTMFDQQQLGASPGTIAIAIDNRDEGVPHNFAVYRSEDDLAEPLAATDIESGPVTQEVTFDLKAGEYFFQCDVHPATMRGTLIVE